MTSASAQNKAGVRRPGQDGQRKWVLVMFLTRNNSAVKISKEVTPRAMAFHVKFMNTLLESCVGWRFPRGNLQKEFPHWGEKASSPRERHSWEGRNGSSLTADSASVGVDGNCQSTKRCGFSPSVRG